MHISTTTKKIHPKGFTLVEIIVTTVIVSLLLPIVSLVLFSVIRQQIAVTRLSEVKRQGDLAMDAIKTKITRDISHMYSDADTELCVSESPTPASIAYFTDKSGNKIEYTLTPSPQGVLTYTYNDGAGTPVTSSKVTVSDLAVQCIKSASYARPLVSVHFVVGYNGPPSALDVNPSLTYSTKIIVLN